MKKPQIKSTSYWIIITILLLLLPSACSRCSKKQPAPPPPSVTVMQPVKQSVTSYLEATGNTQAVNSVQLTARVPGYLEKVFFRDGQLVKEGELLFVIQQNTYQNALKQAEAQIALFKSQREYAELQLNRYLNLLPQKAAAQSDVDNWRAQRDTADANLKNAIAARNIAKLNLDYTRVVAPFDGRIDRRLQDPGNMVGSSTSNTNLAQISQLDPIYVYFNISDTDLARFIKNTGWTPGKTKTFKWPVSAGMTGEDDYPHSGRLDFASISLTSTTGSLLMRGIFPNADGKILPGLYARVRMPIEKNDLFVLPAVAIANDQQGSYVLIVDEKNTVERRSIKPGTLINDNVRAVEEGLNGTEWVIVEGMLKARPGAQVTPERKQIPMAKHQ